jgi:uncharacterized protein (TIGR01777 family)
MKVLIAGATGFIGKELLRKLDEIGYEIIVLTTNKEVSSFHIPIHCKIHQWNPNLNPLPSFLLKDVDAVINLAGENIASKFWTEKRKAELINSRIMSTRRIIQAIEAMHVKPKVFLSASAIGYYGDQKNEELSELSNRGNGFLSKICQAWENEIFKCQDLGVRTAAFRFGMVLGHHGGALEKIIPAFKLGLGGNLGNGKQWMSWIHVIDAVNMITYSIDNHLVNGVINAVSPNSIQNKEFTKQLASYFKRPAILPVPSFVLKFILRELSDLLLNSQKVSSDKIINYGFKFKYPIFFRCNKRNMLTFIQ